MARKKDKMGRRKRDKGRQMVRRGGSSSNTDQALSPDARRYKVAKSRANNRVAFTGHAVVYGATCLFIAVVASLKVAMIVGLSWGILLAAHFFFFVAAPRLREGWIAEEIDRNVHDGVVHERRALGEAHSKSMHRLSASVAHEIRNPITAAKSLVQQIGEDPTSADNVEYCRVAVEELDHLLHLALKRATLARRASEATSDAPHLLIDDRF